MARILVVDDTVEYLALVEAYLRGSEFEVTTADGGQAALERCREQAFDLILLDVPCSNSGVLARRPEARYRFSKARTKSVLELQQKIADPAIGLVAPRGAVLYATCSIERGENEAQVKRLASNFGLSLVVERTIMPAGLPGEPASLYRDGGYHALLALA